MLYVHYYNNYYMCIFLDINECGANPCDTNAMCMDTHGSHVCTCNDGYTGNGLACESNACSMNKTMCSHYYIITSDVNECVSSPCHSNATCDDTTGSFTCTCLGGFSGDGFQCESIDR